VIRLDDRRASLVTPLDRVGESVLDTRVDLELAYSPREKLALDLGDERPHKAPPAIRRIDQDVEEARAARGPGRARDSESNERLSVPCRHHDSVAVRGLPAHFARRERAWAPLLAFEFDHPRTQLTPGGGIERDRLDRRCHYRLVTWTTRASPARSLITRVSPPSEY
jgi:hypothetical protein